ncbi:MAG TPA: cupin domain-containing protein [Acidisarcina sp.]
MRAPESELNVLDWLLAPVSLEFFLAEHWGQKPLLLHRQDANYYSSLLRDSDLDYVLHAAARRRGNIEVLSGGGRPQTAGGVEGTVRAVRQGSSLRINAIQRFSPALARTRAALEQRFSCTVNMNMYLTPGDGKALGKHVDTHDVLVLQIAGQKRWQLFDSVYPDPLENLPQLRGESKAYQKRYRLPNPSAPEDANLTEDFMLRAGDLLYLPRGHQHAAQGELRTVSCHITVGFQVLTQLDLLSVALASAAQGMPGLRKALPAGFSWDPTVKQAAIQQSMELLKQLPENMQPESAFGEVARLFTRGRDNLTTNRLLQPRAGPSSIELETRLRKRSGIVLGIDRDAESIRLMWREVSLTLPLKLDTSCQFVLEHEVFRPSDLPTDLADEEKVAFCRDLEEMNLLFVAGRRQASRAPALNADMTGWLPIDYDSKKGMVTWQFFGERSLEEPFYRQAVRRSQASQRAVERRRTPVPQPAGARRPAGFVFHISRCGSTLVSNALRSTGQAMVISEAEPVNQAITALERSADAGALRGIVDVFCGHGTPPPPAIFKLTSWNVLDIAQFRRLWPDVPMVIVIRNPEQVMVSCLATPPGWMQWKEHPERIGLGFEGFDAVSGSDEEFCARVLGRFMQAALDSFDQQMMVVDYVDLRADTIALVAGHFGLELDSGAKEAIERSLAVYSKDPTGSRLFVPDDESKNSAVTKEIRSAAEQWASKPYGKLLKLKTYGGTPEAVSSPGNPRLD